MPLDNVPTDSTVPDDVLPAGELPPLRYRELPEPVSIRKMIGPSVILAGLALGSGEFVIWPYITYQTGFIFFWACLLGVATQYFLNLEIIRWSLATGESAVTGFTRLSRHWAWIFLFLNIVPWMVPAWATGAAQLISWLGWGVDGDPLASPYVTHLAVASLFACGIVLTAGKVVYETVEKVQFVLVALVLVLVVVLAFWLVVAEGRGDAVAAQLQGAVNFGAVPDFTEQLTPAVLLGALAFAGVGGTLNLGQSNYVKDKGYGMGKYIGRITSPITGQEEAMSEVGYHFPHTPENLQRWRRWWRSARTEHFLTFFLTCIVCLILLTLVSYCLFYNPDGTPNAQVGQYAKGGMSFVWGEAVELERLLGPTVKGLFLLMGVAILLTTEFGVLDAATRVSTDIVKVSWLRDSSRWTESRLYYVFLWGLILLGTLILLDPKQRISAFGLFKFSAAMNGGVMFIYSGLLLYLNRFKLPRAVRMGWVQVLILTWSTLFFGYFSFMTLKGLLF